MQEKQHLGKYIAACLLTLTLMLPTAIQVFHASEVHEHITCTKKYSHIHTAFVECDLCDFNLTSLSYDFKKYPDIAVPNIFWELNSTFTTSQFHSFKITSTQLRGPPFFLS